MAKHLCNRHLGIGADGIIALSGHRDQFLMTVINADGSLAKNCGNGLRCAALHIYKTFGIERPIIALGEREFICRVELDEISVAMGSCEVMPLEEIVLRGGLRVKTAEIHIGNKHRVLFFSQPVTCFNDVIDEIAAHQYVDTNIGIMFAMGVDQVFLRVHERGVGFTNSCGSGACAAACFVATLFCHEHSKETTIIQPGGTLQILYTRKASTSNSALFNVIQKGNAAEIFSGICQLSANC